MKPPYRLLSCCAFMLVLACGDNGSATSATPTTDPTSDTTAPTTTTTTSDPPTTSTTVAPTTTEAMTSTTGTSTTGTPASNCSQYKDVNACAAADCEWTQIVGYTHGTQGCQGDIRDFCVPKNTSGGLTSMWNDDNNDIEVVQFPFTPDDLPGWQVCDCDGPLACLCTAAPLDCPDRLEAFCSAITGDNGCKNAAAAGELTCARFSVSKEGPLDASCAGDPHADICLPATKIGQKTCDQITLPYPGVCTTPTDPVFWREVDGTVQVTKTCGPEPVGGWTLCVADDPGQPEECKCRCL